MIKHRRICFVLMLSLLVYPLSRLFPARRDIFQQFTCPVYDNDLSVWLDEVTVTFTGEYADYLWGTDTFTGTIEIPSMEIVANSCTAEKLPVQNFNQESLNVVYDGQKAKDTMGLFYGAEDLDSFVLWLMVPDDVGSHARYLVCYPEMTTDDLFRILDQG